MSLTEKQAKDIGRQIVKDSNEVRVKFGEVNGEVVLHVYVPGKKDLARDVKSLSEWEDHPANGKAERDNRFAAEQAVEALVEGNRGETDRG